MIKFNKIYLGHNFKIIKVYDSEYYIDFICENCNISGYYYKTYSGSGCYMILTKFNDTNYIVDLTCEEIQIKILLE